MVLSRSDLSRCHSRARDPARYLSSRFEDEPATLLGTTFKPLETSVQVRVYALRVNIARAIERRVRNDTKILGKGIKDRRFIFILLVCYACLSLCAHSLRTLHREERGEGSQANFKFQIISPETTGRGELVYIGNFRKMKNCSLVVEGGARRYKPDSAWVSMQSFLPK